MNKQTVFIGVLILGLFVAYYFGTQNRLNVNNSQSNNPSQTNLKDELANKEKCNQVGETIYNQDAANAASDAIPTQMLGDHEYAYNSKLNTCLYKGGYTQEIPNSKAEFGHDLIYTWWVKDSLTNKDIIDISYNINEIDCSHQTCTKDRDAEVNDFMNQANNLMNGN